MQAPHAVWKEFALLARDKLRGAHRLNGRNALRNQRLEGYWQFEEVMSAGKRA